MHCLPTKTLFSILRKRVIGGFSCVNTRVAFENKVFLPNLFAKVKEGYKKYLRDNITKTYKKSSNSKVNRVDLDAEKIVDKLSISDKIDQLQKHETYITVKDHKKDFPSFRLINPSHWDQISAKLAKLFWIEWTKKLHLLYKLTGGKTVQQ